MISQGKRLVEKNSSHKQGKRRALEWRYPHERNTGGCDSFPKEISQRKHEWVLN